MDRSKVSLRLSLDYGLTTKVACLDISRYTEEDKAFEVPICRLSDGASVVEKMIHRPTPEGEALLIIRHRKKIAKAIVNEMVEFLLDGMSTNDTLNGYPDEGIKR